jgi:hypothetical protein
MIFANKDTLRGGKIYVSLANPFLHCCSPRISPGICITSRAIRQLLVDKIGFVAYGLFGFSRIFKQSVYMHRSTLEQRRSDAWNEYTKRVEIHVKCIQVLTKYNILVVLKGSSRS